jgi:redox-sensitive bicupin YhaK (pirin superfamily)
MPKQEKGIWGFQLWVNLPKASKMMDPRYRDVTKEQIPKIKLDTGTTIKIISGSVGDTKGPVQDIVVDIAYLDVTVPSETIFEHNVKKGYTTFAYVSDGEGYFDEDKNNSISSEHLVLYEDGDAISVSTKNKPVRFLLISGKPLKEPVAWGGPIVMNTQKELDHAFEELQKGTFIKFKGNTSVKEDVHRNYWK